MSGVSTLQVEKSDPSPANAATGPSIEFFAVGFVINLVLIVAFFVWAFKQGKK